MTFIGNETMEKLSTLVKMKQSMSALLDVVDVVCTRSLEQEKEIEGLTAVQDLLEHRLDAFDNLLTEMLDDYESEHGKDEKHKLWIKNYEGKCRFPI